MRLLNRESRLLEAELALDRAQAGVPVCERAAGARASLCPYCGYAYLSMVIELCTSCLELPERRCQASGAARSCTGRAGRPFGPQKPLHARESVKRRAIG